MNTNSWPYLQVIWILVILIGTAGLLHLVINIKFRDILSIFQRFGWVAIAPDILKIISSQKLT